MMHLLAVNYYVHCTFTSPVNPKDKVKSIAKKAPFTLNLLAVSATRRPVYCLKPAPAQIPVRFSV
ncbi:hypothetical protein FPT12_26615 [Pseudomonas sp. H3(2019)]|nr:hypothetical protein FPT12_26615 [Pseudomonas sp. H3(2019)]